MAVLFYAPYLEFRDNNGLPLALGTVTFFEAGTTTPKAVYTTAAGDVPLGTSLTLDAAGRPTVTPWGIGSYKVTVTSADGSFTKTTDGITMPLTSSGGTTTVSLPGLKSGLSIANNTGTPNSLIDIAPGSATSSQSSYALMKLTGTLTKSIAANWAVGTSAGGLDTGTKANSTWYHVYAIQTNDGTVTDAIFSTNPATPSFPTGYNASRRIGSIYVNASGNIDTFTQNGNAFYWATPLTDISAATLSTTRTSYALRVPLGVKTRPMLSIRVAGGGDRFVMITDPSAADIAPTSTLHSISTLKTGDASYTGMNWEPLTNTASQIAMRADVASATITGITHGWIDNL